MSNGEFGADHLRQMARPEDGRISLRDVLRNIMIAFGGPEGFARKVFGDWTVAKPGSANRIRIESDIMRLLERTGDEGADDLVDAQTLEAMERELRDANA